MCPLKEAARDAPNLIALLSKEVSFTFAELDRFVDTVQPTLFIQEKKPLFIIAQMFSNWRHNQAIFPIHPQLSQKPQITDAPSQSLLLYTSGSTSEPKIAILSLKNLLANASTAVPAVDLRAGDQWRLTLPLYHVGGIGTVLRCILARATIVLDDSPNITHLSYVPTHLYRATPIYKHLRCLLLGGAPIYSYPQHLPIYTTYGLTEMASMVTLNGKILPNRELKIEDDGEILVRGACLFQGYYLSPHQPSNWFATKDLGSIQNGKLEITGRKDWMFISGGENIQPEEIERLLLTHSQVFEAVVLPIDDAEFGKRPVAIVRAASSFNLKRMHEHLSKLLPKFKIPVALFFINEMPQKDKFKLNRFILSQYINNQIDRERSGQKKSSYL